MAKRDIHIAIMKAAAKGNGMLWLSADDVKQLSDISGVHTRALLAADIDPINRPATIDWRLVRDPQ